MSFTPIQLNGRYFDLTSVRVSGLPAGIDDVFFTKHIMSITYSEKITHGKPQGVHGIPLPRTRGRYEASASFEVSFEAWAEFCSNLASQGISGYSDFTFDLLIQYKTAGRSAKVELKYASLGAPEGTDKHGEGLTRKIPVEVQWIETNGVCAYPLDLDQDLTAAETGITYGV